MDFKVPDMSCAHCKAAIEEAVAAAGGTAQVDLTAKSVKVDGLDPTQAEATIRAAGYSPEPA